MKTNKKEKITTDLEIPKAKITYVHNVKTLLSSIGDKQKECNKQDRRPKMNIQAPQKDEALPHKPPLAFSQKTENNNVSYPQLHIPSIPPHPDAISLGQQTNLSTRPPPCNQVK